MVRRNKLKSGFISIVALIALQSIIVTPWASEDNRYDGMDFIMDTIVSQTLYSSGEDTTADYFSVIHEVEDNMISWNIEDSEISNVNASNGSTQQISEGLSACLKPMLDLCEASDGAYDPTMGDVIRLWDIDGENPHIPKEEELNDLMQYVGYEQIELKDTELYLPSHVTIDMGAIGKGIGCDELKKVLSNDEKVSAAMFSLGSSSIMTYGSKPNGSAWNIAITDPRDTEGDFLGILSLEGTSFISTSGDYEKYFIEDGVRYHHILDPETGYPVHNGLDAVMVVSDSGLEADGLSTACFVLGLEAGQKLLDKYDAEGIFITEDYEIYITDGLKDSLELKKDNYTIVD